MKPTEHRARLSSPIVLASLLCACGGAAGDGGATFVPRTTAQSVAPGTALAVSTRYLAFLADEATTAVGGTDFNADGDKLDSIAVAVDMGTNTQTVLNVSASEMAWIGAELYLVTDEADDNEDWNADTDMTDLVLLHWSAVAGAVQFVDELNPAGTTHLVARGNNLFYASASVPAGALASNLAVISSGSPMTHTPVVTTDATGPLSPRFFAQDEGLVFLALDETVEARDLNGDADATDTAVLALLDATSVAGVVANTGLALPAAGSPVRARSSGSHDWQVGFLVSEADQGNTNLNDPALFGASWQPTQCIGHADADTSDNVLHVLTFATWLATPLTHPPINTGLVGTRKIAVASNFVATISRESDEGTCDLNLDGDTADFVVRWTEIATPVLPLNQEANILALFDCPGGTHGLAELDSRFVIVVDEASENTDIDSGGLTHDLVAWLLPSNTSHAWDFTHGAGAGDFVGATWMAEQPDHTRLNVAFSEAVADLNINSHTPAVAGEDTDKLDSVPTFADFTGPNTLSFPGVAIACDSINSGITIGKSIGFYRVNEAQDSRDWNNDGDETDWILFRTSITQATSSAMAVLNNVSIGGQATPAVYFDTFGTPQGAAFIVDEALVGSDVNNDGTQHFVIEFFRF